MDQKIPSLFESHRLHSQSKWLNVSGTLAKQQGQRVFHSSSKIPILASLEQQHQPPAQIRISNWRILLYEEWSKDLSRNNALPICNANWQYSHQVCDSVVLTVLNHLLWMTYCNVRCNALEPLLDRCIIFTAELATFSSTMLWCFSPMCLSEM